MDVICLIAAPRAGTHRLCGALGDFEELACHPAPFRQAGDGNPSAWLDAAEAAAAAGGKRLMGFGLAPDDLPVETIEREIMPRPGLRAILVVRKQIDAYVSWLRSRYLGTMPAAGGARVRVKLDADRFEAWLDAQERWYGHWRDYFARRYLPCPVIRYELDIDQSRERVLRRFAAAAAQVGITLRLPATPGDRDERGSGRALLADKVANWPEFNRRIFARGLERRAFGYPL